MRRSSMVLFVSVLAIFIRPALQAQSAHPVVGIEGDHCTKNGQPEFPTFVCYFAALQSADPLGDMEYFNDHVDGVRILPNWWTYGCGPNGATRAPSPYALFT